MAGTATLNRSDWTSALDQLTAGYEGRYVMIELLAPVVGTSMSGTAAISYINHDPKDDGVIVAVGGNSSQYPVVLRHMVWHPTEVDIAVEEVSEPAADVNELAGQIVLTEFPHGALEHRPPGELGQLGRTSLLALRSMSGSHFVTLGGVLL